MKNCVPITKCLACDGDNLIPLLDLGHQPLANGYLKELGDIPKTYPLAVNRCGDCYHVQLTHQVNPELMFKDYAYVSGTSKLLLDFFDWVTTEIDGKAKSVLDIGCNDGSMLDSWAKMDNTIERYGVDPAENLFNISASKGHNIRCGFFTGKEFGDKKFDVITCFNAFAHNPNPLQLLLNVKELMDDDSLFVCSTSQAYMIQNGEFDTIYHEHTSFFNIRSMEKLCERAGLVLVDEKLYDIHGISRIFYIKKSGQPNAYLPFAKALEPELYVPVTYDMFSKKAHNVMESFSSYISLFRYKGRPIIGYTASARGNTFLNATQVKLDMIFEDTSLKQNTYSPGMNIPIVAPDFSKIEHEESILWVILAWPLFDVIKEKIKKERPTKNDLFLRNFPEPVVSI